MTSKELDRRLQQIEQWRASGRQLLHGADALEVKLWREVGVKHVQREPGFPCWTFEGAGRWFGTAEEAMGARLEGQA